MKILINNKFVKKDEAQVSIFSDALMYGYGVFETLRTYKERKVFRLKEHVSRLINSADLIDLILEFNFEEIQQMVLRVVEKSEFDLQRIKILAIPDNLIVISKKLNVDKNVYQGISLKTVTHKRSLPEFKSTSYMDCIFHHNRVVNQGYYDALFIDENDFVYECSRSNIFWINNKKIFTRKNDVLPGITRQIIIENSLLPFEYKNENLSELVESEEVFITNSIIGIVPVIKIDDIFISSGLPGIETKKILNDLENLLKN